MKDKQIVTRFAPSPTGFLHAGAYRTAIYSFLHAKHNNGKFILRIEDTDRERSTKEYEDNIKDTLEWLNLKYDEIYKQSDRRDRHTYYLQKMIDDGFAYEAEEKTGDLASQDVNRSNDEKARPAELRRSRVIRFRNPNKIVSFEDSIRGHIEFDTTELKDFIIAKSISEPLFHLAVIVDDFEMGVTDIIRGEEHISNTPRQILIGEAIGAPTFRYAHLPIVLDTDRTKLSKRKGAKPITEYRDMGYLKEALLNYISLVGWNPGTEQEIFTEDELIKTFDLSQVHKAGAIFDEIKLQWVNKEHLKKLSAREFKNEVLKRVPGSISSLPTFKKRIDETLDIVRERISYFGEINIIFAEGELDYFFQEPIYGENLLLPSSKMLKGAQISHSEISEILSKIKTILENIKENEWGKQNVKDALWQYAEEKGRAKVLWPLRVALSGKEKSADPFTIAEIIGKFDTLKRIDDATK